MKKVIKKYKAKEGYARISDKDAEIIGKRVEYLMELTGDGVKPADLVNDAKSKKSPIHKYFDWDNNKAANKWRLEQARNLLQAVVEVVVVEGKKTEARSFYNVVNKEKEHVYVTLKTALSTPSYTKQLLSDAQDYIEHFLKVIKLLKAKIK